MSRFRERAPTQARDDGGAFRRCAVPEPHVADRGLLPHVLTGVVVPAVAARASSRSRLGPRASSACRICSCRIRRCIPSTQHRARPVSRAPPRARGAFGTSFANACRRPAPLLSRQATPRPSCSRDERAALGDRADQRHGPRPPSAASHFPRGRSSSRITRRRTIVMPIRVALAPRSETRRRSRRSCTPICPAFASPLVGLASDRVAPRSRQSRLARTPYRAGSSERQAGICCDLEAARRRCG